MSKVLALPLEELATLADFVAQSTGGAPKIIAHVTAIGLRAADGITRIVDAAELERIRKEQELHQAAGRSAYDAAKNAGKS